MSFLTSSFLRPLAQWYSEINSATLTGALDVVVVEQPDGSFRSSPFHVRFGKLGVLKAREKIVDIEVNDEPVDVHMKLDAFGAAFFVEDNDDIDDDINDDINDDESEEKRGGVPSPIPEKRDSDSETLETSRAATTTSQDVQMPQQPSFSSDEELNNDNVAVNGSRKKRRRRGKHVQSASKSSLQEMMLSNRSELEKDKSLMRITSKEEGDDPEHQTSFLQCRLSGQSIDTILKSQRAVNNVDQEAYFSEPEKSEKLQPLAPEACLSDSEVDKPFQECKAKSEQAEQNWEWGQLPSTTLYDPKTVVSTGQELKEESISTNAGIKDVEGSRRSRAWTFSFWRSSENAKAPHNTPSENVPNVVAPSSAPNNAEGMYLDDLKDDEELISIYVGSTRHSHNSAPIPMVNDDAESGKGASLPISPHSVEGAIGGPALRHASNYSCSSDEEQTQQTRKFASRLLPDMAFSLCGGLATDGRVTSALFEQCLLSYDDFIDHLRAEGIDSLLNNPDLVVRIGNKYLSWSVAAPTVLSALLYGRKLPSDLCKDNKAFAGSVTPPKPKASSWWPFGGRGGNVGTEVKSASLDSKVETDVLRVETAAETGNSAAVVKVSEESLDVTVVKEDGYPVREHSYSKRTTTASAYRKTLRLSSDLIKKLKLKPGVNEAQFSVTTQYQGTKRCKCHIYWWKWNSKIVVSDIDGTITKSDVLGHVLPIIGRDWAQSGVASLFQKIVGNGYKVLYLSARAIGQSSVTKDYLASIKQGDISLPDGPLLLNPTSLISAFHREVVEKKPEVFKIACLSDIRSLFPTNPLYAGYGNRINDVFAYRTVGIPISRIFTINSRGELRHELTQTFQTSYDCQSSIVDHVFPPLSDHDNEEEGNGSDVHQDFSSFSHWRDPIQDINLDDLQ